MTIWRSLWLSLKEYIKRLFFVILAWVLTWMLGVTGAMDLLGFRALTIQELALLLALGVFIAAFTAFHGVRQERDETWAKLERRDEIKGILHKLATLRSEGVKLRNSGTRKRLTGKGLDDWIAEAEHWENSTNEAARKLAEFEEEWLTTLDKVDKWPTLRCYPRRQRQKVWNLGGTIKRLDLLIDNYRPINWTPTELPPWLERKA